MLEEQLEGRKLCEVERIGNWVGQVYVLHACINLIIVTIYSLNNAFYAKRNRSVLNYAIVSLK